MKPDTFQTINRLEADLWESADQLRANSKLNSSEYYMPVLGVIFLRHAANRFAMATEQIAEEQAGGKMPQRPLVAGDYARRRALFLPETARYDWIMAHADTQDPGDLLKAAMDAIEEQSELLAGVLPKEYGLFEKNVLRDLLRIFNRESLRQASGDVFGRIYEFFLMKFAMEGAQDKGEFFTPPSLVQTIVNVIEPNHGKVFDPACGSGGMFVQTSHFIERMGQDTAHSVRFYGQEKTATTIRLAKMNLAVHGLDGNILEANTFYQDEHTLVGACDFVMANPPFNVDMVDADKVSADTARLPFGLPGVSKGKSGKNSTVSNGNYLWISYFWSYLNPTGRAGFVMSSQASSAGHGEKTVRQKIVETGDVDVMISIRSNFFYTRTVPCELWFFDRAKPAERRDRVLMLDARSLYRKVTRKIYDFSPEQEQNLTAIVWLYRGQTERYLGLVRSYFAQVVEECARVAPLLAAFDRTRADILARCASAAQAAKGLPGFGAEEEGSGKAALSALEDSMAELCAALPAFDGDRDSLLADLEGFRREMEAQLPADNAAQHTAAQRFAPCAEQCRGLVKQIDLLYKLTARMTEQAGELTGEEAAAAAFDRRAAGRLVKQLDEQRREAVEQLKLPAYFHRQIGWLQERFPDAVLRDVPGLARVVDTAAIAAADWSLTPGRYVGVAPAEEDEDFDFEATLRDIHVELADLNKEAIQLAAQIQTNFEELAL